jgi:hypothetical protein
VRGDHAIGCQSFAPGALGQIMRTTTPVFGSFSATGCTRPVRRSTPRYAVMKWNGSAESTSPLVRSST